MRSTPIAALILACSIHTLAAEADAATLDDASTQRLVEQIVARHVPPLPPDVAAAASDDDMPEENPTLIATVVVVDVATRRVRATVPDVDRDPSRLALTPHSVGSAFWPVIVATALSRGDAKLSSPMPTDGSWLSSNKAVKSGPSLQDAFINGKIQPMLYLMSRSHADVVKKAQALGFTTELIPTSFDAAVSTAATPYQLASAVASFAARGSFKPLTGRFTTVVKQPTEAQQVFSLDIATKVDSLLAARLRQTVGEKASSGLMGLSSFSNDGFWFSGGSPKTVCVVWVGRIDGQYIATEQMKEASRVTQELWLDLMGQLRAAE